MIAEKIYIELYQSLNKLISRQNKKSFYEEVGEIIMNSLILQFAKEGREFGEKWQALDPATQKARAKKNKWPGQILQVSGHLKGSFYKKATNTGVEISTNVEYAPYLHYGTKFIPARPIFPTTLSDIPSAVIQEIHEAWLYWMMNG